MSGPGEKKKERGRGWTHDHARAFVFKIVDELVDFFHLVLDIDHLAIHSRLLLGNIFELRD